MSYAAPSLMAPFARPASRVAIVPCDRYDRDITGPLSEALKEFVPPVRGKSVLLKPNFVEPDCNQAINTHPAVIGAVREIFQQLGAKSVCVAEGSGHERDTEAILETIRLRDFIAPLREIFIDLNLAEVRAVQLRTRASKLKQLYFPRAVLQADYIVSLPKLKTHHWAGVTISLKNMFGTVPGCCYGWPKNVLHWAGITASILDINSTVRPDFAIVDGIVGMEGNGPIQGSAKSSGVLVLGDDPVAVDATCARIMGLNPERIDYLAKAGLLLGHLHADKIQQIGASIASVVTPFAVLPEFRKLYA